MRRILRYFLETEWTHAVTILGNHSPILVTPVAFVMQEAWLGRSWLGLDDGPEIHDSFAFWFLWLVDLVYLFDHDAFPLVVVALLKQADPTAYLVSPRSRHAHFLSSFDNHSTTVVSRLRSRPILPYSSPCLSLSLFHCFLTQLIKVCTAVHPFCVRLYRCRRIPLIASFLLSGGRVVKITNKTTTYVYSQQ